MASRQSLTNIDSLADTVKEYLRHTAFEDVNFDFLHSTMAVRPSLADHILAATVLSGAAALALD